MKEVIVPTSLVFVGPSLASLEPARFSGFIVVVKSSPVRQHPGEAIQNGPDDRETDWNRHKPKQAPVECPSDTVVAEVGNSAK
jgi:hypothetical protein